MFRIPHFFAALLALVAGCRAGAHLLTWDPNPEGPEPAGYMVYASTNLGESFDFVYDVGPTTNAVIWFPWYGLPLNVPNDAPAVQWGGPRARILVYAATAYDQSRLESEFSNLAWITNKPTNPGLLAVEETDSEFKDGDFSWMLGSGKYTLITSTNNQAWVDAVSLDFLGVVSTNWEITIKATMSEPARFWDLRHE